MKLAQFLHDGRPRVGIVRDAELLALVLPGHMTPDRAIVQIAMDGVDELPVDVTLPLQQARLLAPIRKPPSIRDFLCFEEHLANMAAAAGDAVPPAFATTPPFYFTSPHVIHGPDDEIPYPATSALDYELEVAAVVGRRLRDADRAEATNAIAGFTIFNDFSARDLQRIEMALLMGPAKGKDFAHALGPVLVTPDELAGEPARPEATMIARVNSQEMSRGRLETMRHDFADILVHASRNTVVAPGDIVGTGTVGKGCLAELRYLAGDDSIPWLQPGDLIELEVDGIGVLANRVSPPRDGAPAD